MPEWDILTNEDEAADENIPVADEDISVPDEVISANVMNTMADAVSELGARMAALEELFEAKILHTEHEEKIVDRMHRELQRYKEDMYSQLVRPILLDMIEMRDSILRVTAAHLDKPIPVKTFAMYASDVQEILEKNNVEIYNSGGEADFLPVRQRAVKKVLAHDQSLHGKVAESLSDGYAFNGKVISAEKVAVYCYEQSQEQSVESMEKHEEERGNG